MCLCDVINLTDCNDKILVCIRCSCWNLGAVSEFDIRKGPIWQLFLTVHVTHFVKIFNSSHMAPYDLPDIAHDMILRFMGMDFSAINDGTALIPSKVGDEEKPSFTQVAYTSAAVIPVPAGKTPEQDKAMWEGA